MSILQDIRVDALETDNLIMLYVHLSEGGVGAILATYPQSESNLAELVRGTLAEAFALCLNHEEASRRHRSTPIA